MKKLIALILVLIMVVGLVACAEKPAANTDSKGTIAVIAKGETHAFWQAVKAGAVAAGNGMELDAVAGVYIGGTSTTGGSATIIGTILGSMILVIIRQGLNLAMAGGVGISATNITFAVTGIIVVGAVMLDVLKKKNAAKVKIPVTEKKDEAKAK